MPLSQSTNAKCHVHFTYCRMWSIFIFYPGNEKGKILNWKIIIEWLMAKSNVFFADVVVVVGAGMRFNFDVIVNKEQPVMMTGCFSHLLLKYLLIYCELIQWHRSWAQTRALRNTARVLIRRVMLWGKSTDFVGLSNPIRKVNNTRVPRKIYFPLKIPKYFSSIDLAIHDIISWVHAMLIPQQFR